MEHNIPEHKFTCISYLFLIIIQNYYSNKKHEDIISVIMNNLCALFFCVLLSTDFTRLYRHLRSLYKYGLYGLTLIPLWISNYMPNEVCYELLIQNLTVAAVGGWDWMNNLISHFNEHVITYLTDAKLIHISTRCHRAIVPPTSIIATFQI